VLPLGTIVEISAGSYSGHYAVLDTGGDIKGRRIDIYIPDQRDALRFGRRTVQLKVIKSERARRAVKSRFSRRTPSVRSGAPL
jgi:hypothetical protein